MDKLEELKNELWHELDCPAHSDNMGPEKDCDCLMGKAQESIDQAFQLGRESGRDDERKLWADCFKQQHDRLKKQAYTRAKEILVPDDRLKWRLLYETLAEAVVNEVPFPGETADGRCPKCDDKVPCAYCIANVEPHEAQEQILNALNACRSQLIAKLTESGYLPKP